MKKIRSNEENSHKLSNMH